MKKNDVVQIRNKAGILDIQLVERLSNRDVFRGFEKRLVFPNGARWEFHRNKCHDDYIITLCDNDYRSETMYVAFLYYGRLEIWVARMLGSERDDEAYVTMDGAWVDEYDDYDEDDE